MIVRRIADAVVSAHPLDVSKRTFQKNHLLLVARLQTKKLAFLSHHVRIWRTQQLSSDLTVLQVFSSSALVLITMKFFLERDHVSPSRIRMPAEWEPHACCWMAWAVHSEWGKNVNKVKAELSEIIRTVALYEPVRLLAARGDDLREAQIEFGSCANITLIEAPVDDIWMRDIASTFAIREHEHSQEVVAIDWNFNAWGGTRERPPRLGDKLVQYSETIFGVPRVAASFIAEGGAMITDGQGTVITTRSCLLNRNRNPIQPGRETQLEIETQFSDFGVRRVIWLEGDPSEPITSGHIDGYVMFAPSDVLLVETLKGYSFDMSKGRLHDIDTLKQAKTANGMRFDVVEVKAPRLKHCRSRARTSAPCYLNAYVANGAVLTARFGDPERDEEARKALAKAFPTRTIAMVNIDAIAAGGGGIHCLTQPMPNLIRSED